MTTEKQKTKMLVIGMDAGEQSIVLHWARKGVLPNIGALLNQGVAGITEGLPAFFVGSIWPSFSTSTGPMKHGRYNFKQLKPGTYESPRFKCMTDLKRRPFWETLSSNGKRIAIIDVPKICLSENINGLHVVDWLTHDADPTGLKTYPESLARELTLRYGVNPLPKCDAKRSTVEEYLKFYDQLIHQIEIKEAFVEDVLSRGSWDCVITVFSQSHCAGHQLWHFNAPSSAHFNSEVFSQTGNLFKRVYQRFDEAVGKLIKAAGEDAKICLFTSHGMTNHHDGNYLLPEILKRLEPAELNVSYSSPSTKILSLARAFWQNFIPENARRAFTKGAIKKLAFDVPSIRTCFKVPNNDVWGAVRINVIGREPKGKVALGKEYEHVCKTLKEGLLELVNAETGEKAVRNVYHCSEIYPGEDVRDFPDILIEWNHASAVAPLYSKRMGRINVKYTGCRTGDHKPEGSFIYFQKGIQPKFFDQSISIMDLGPTLCDILGVSLDNVDGKSFVNQVVPGHSLETVA